MFKKCLAFALVVLISNSVCGVSVFAQTGEDKEAKHTRNVRRTVTNHGIGAKVLVKLKDGTTLKGSVGDIKDDGFVVTNKKTGAMTAVTYSQVKRAQYPPSILKSAAIAAGVFVGIGVVGAILLATGVIEDR